MFINKGCFVPYEINQRDVLTTYRPRPYISKSLNGGLSVDMRSEVKARAARSTVNSSQYLLAQPAISPDHMRTGYTALIKYTLIQRIVLKAIRVFEHHNHQVILSLSRECFDILGFVLTFFSGHRFDLVWGASISVFRSITMLASRPLSSWRGINNPIHKLVLTSLKSIKHSKDIMPIE